MLIQVKILLILS